MLYLQGWICLVILPMNLSVVISWGQVWHLVLVHILRLVLERVVKDGLFLMDVSLERLSEKMVREVLCTTVSLCDFFEKIQNVSLFGALLGL